MSDLAEFLLARIAEDEADARVASLGPWVVEHSKREGPTITAPRDRERNIWGIVVSPGDAGRGGIYRDEDAAHIARHDSTRVLAECEAKRRIVERETERLLDQWRRRRDEHRQTFDEWLRPPYGETLRDFASVYADHPDYRQEWKP